MLRRVSWFVAASTLTGCCATQLDRVILLPDASGTVGKIAIIGKDSETVLDKPYATARTNDQGISDSGQLTEAEVRKKYGAELAALPSRPISFVVYFAGDSDRLTPESLSKIPSIVEEIRSRPAPELEVIGHTDTQGSVEYNDQLSLKRAGAVRTQLIGLKIGVSNIHVSGRGERSLAVQTPDETNEPRNRRAEISVR